MKSLFEALIIAELEYVDPLLRTQIMNVLHRTQTLYGDDYAACPPTEYALLRNAVKNILVQYTYASNAKVQRMQKDAAARTHIKQQRIE